MEVISLLESKGRCLRKFLRITQEAQARLEKGDFSDLAQLERRREHLVKAICLFEDRITEAARERTPSHQDAAMLARIHTILDEHSNILAEVIRADAAIEACIESEKERIRAEIAAGAQTRARVQTHQRFKSEWVARSGEGLDQKL